MRAKDSAIAGAVSGITARVITTPLDVIKIRFQLQLEPIRFSSDHVSKYRGMTHAVQRIVAEEGIWALWKGTVPGLLMYAVYGSVQFGCYDLSKKFLNDQLKVNNNIVKDSIGGFIGGSVASFVVQPLDVLRTRLAGQGEPKHYRNIRCAIKQMYNEMGFRTFYRGLTPAILLIGPQAGLHFGFYSLYNYIWRSFLKGTEGRKGKEALHGNAGVQSLACGALAGVTSKTICLPLDVVKKRLEVRGFEEARALFGRVGHYNGLIDTFAKIWREESVFGFYKGALPSLIKAPLTVSVSFFMYELVMSKMS